MTWPSVLHLPCYFLSSPALTAASVSCRVHRRVRAVGERHLQHHQTEDSVPADGHLVPEPALSLRRRARVRGWTAADYSLAWQPVGV